MPLRTAAPRPAAESGVTESGGQRGFDREAKLTYNSYLKVPELTSLQHLLSSPPHPDELQFIIVHQTYELWFKLVLAELDRARAAMFGGDLGAADWSLRRVHAIETVLVPQIHVLESMSPVAFLAFRDHLRPASGFQSVQFREIELLSGLREENFVNFLRSENVPEVREAVDRRLAEPSLRDAMHAMLQREGLDVGYEAATHAFDEAKLDAALLAVYRTMEQRDVHRVLEGLLQHDESIRLWRHHHVLMVERVIGTKTGTGGSSGAAYLRTTTRFQFFPELWKVRGELSLA